MRRRCRPRRGGAPRLRGLAPRCAREAVESRVSVNFLCALVLATTPPMGGRLLVTDEQGAARMAIGLDSPLDARTFLEQNAGAFGLVPDDQLVLISDGEVPVFERRRAGIPILDGEVKVTHAPNGHIVMVHVGAEPPPTRGNFFVDVAHAERIAAH